MGEARRRRTSAGFMAGQGIKVPASEMRGRMPEKRPGEHRWIMLPVYSLSDAAVRRVYRGERVDLDLENLIDVPVPGCIDCEQAYPAVKDEPCSAGDEWGKS